MAARRSVLNGASAWEREEKANQQRDYAAQLQEQERERAAATRKHQPHQEQTATGHSLAAPSPQRTMPQMPVVELQQHGVPMASPVKSVSTDPGITSTGSSPGVPSTEASLPAPNCGSEAYMPAFSSAPSVFESILREPGIGARSITFYEDLTAFHKLASEVFGFSSKAEANRGSGQLSLPSFTSLKVNVRNTQSHYVKPNFLCQQEVSAASPTTTASHSPVRLSVDKVSIIGGKAEKMLSSLFFVVFCLQVMQECKTCKTTTAGGQSPHNLPAKNAVRISRYSATKGNILTTLFMNLHRSSLDGLLGESVLLPLTTSKLSPSFSHSKMISRVHESPLNHTGNLLLQRRPKTMT
ncbi:hypothetical protein GQ600_10918 [Phytophthora cactorum]|nr:hypothetical protein GQ600_10918 [Phytophthora cactorum]